MLAETTLAEWATAGAGWTHLPYLARFAAAALPAAAVPAGATGLAAE